VLCCAVLGFEGNSPRLFFLRCYFVSLNQSSVTQYPLPPSPLTNDVFCVIVESYYTKPCLYSVSYRPSNYEPSNRARLSVVLFYPSSPTIYRPQFVFVAGTIYFCLLCMVKAQFEMHMNAPIQRGWQGVESSLQARQTSSNDNNNVGGSNNTIIFIVSF
jgi:hypothetical protein